MRRITAYLIGMALLSFVMALKAQVQDKPITVWPTEWVGTVINVTTMGGCIAGWKRGTKDRFEPYYLQQAAFDSSRLQGQQLQQITAGISSKNLALLASMRTISLRDQFPLNDDGSMQPCMDKLQPPPKPWTVAPDADGKRPAYCLNADGTKGPLCGEADTFMPDNTPMPCQPWKARTGTTSIYATWPTAKQTFDPAERVRVTLCRETK